LIYLSAMSFYISTARKILRARFHFGDPFGAYKSFFVFGTASLVGVQVAPLIYVNAVNYYTFNVFDPDLEALTAGDMLFVPLTSLVLLPLLFWAARGLKALSYIRSYPVRTSADQPMPVQ